MPNSHQQRQPGLWESHVQDVFVDADLATVPIRLPAAIFHSGAFNLYGRFDAYQTAPKLRSVTERCAHHCTKVDAAQSVSNW